MPKSRNKRKNRKRNIAIKEQKRNIDNKKVGEHMTMLPPLWLMYDKFFKQ